MAVSVCSVPGCPALAQGPRCRRHEQSHQRQRNARRTEYRGDWPRFALAFRSSWVAQFGWLCAGYERDPHVVPVEVGLHVDHMGEKFSRDPTDYQCLCPQCNGAKGGR